MTISYEKNQYGAWVLYATINGYLESQQFYGYTKKQATQLFRQQFKEKNA
jgi:hypothetical protein